MKLKITCFSVDVAKQLQRQVNNEETVYRANVFRRQEVVYLSFGTSDECDLYIRYAQSRMDELGFIQVERKSLRFYGPKYELVLHKDMYVTPTPYSGTDMNSLNTFLPLDQHTILTLSSIQGVEWICPEITGERYDTSDFTGFRIGDLKLIDRPTVFPYNANPYHNELHCRIVASVAVYLAKYCGVPDTDIALLELAAFLHDVGHSGGVDTDDVNINFVLGYIKDSKYVPQLTKDAMVTLKGLIGATEFPRRGDAIFTELEQILQDADLIATSLCNDSTKYLIGLYEEHLNKRPTLTLNEFYDEQVTFHGWCLDSLLNYQGSRQLMVEVADDVLGELYRYCEANSETDEILDIDPEYDEVYKKWIEEYRVVKAKLKDIECKKVYKKIEKRLGKTLWGGCGAMQSMLEDIGCKKVDYEVLDTDEAQFVFKYKGEKGVFRIAFEYLEGVLKPVRFNLELSTDYTLNLKFLKRLSKVLKKQAKGNINE